MPGGERGGGGGGRGGERGERVHEASLDSYRATLLCNRSIHVLSTTQLHVYTLNYTSNVLSHHLCCQTLHTGKCESVDVKLHVHNMFTFCTLHRRQLGRSCREKML